jgi:hypothetical protein
MKIKTFLKKKLGSNYHKFRLKNILIKIFGKYFLNTREKFKKYISRFDFIKIKLNKKIDHQSIVKKENGILLDLTKNNYLTFHLRPKNSEDFYLESTNKNKEKFAIIIQGPIGKKFSFLKDTINIYKKIFKNTVIIISTWKSENINLINSLKEENVFILFSEEPDKSLYNVDHQIISTNVALKLAREKGALYSIKTRTDTRLYKNNLENFLIALFKTFPVKENNIIKSRIIVPSLVTFKFRIYSLSDIVMIGNTDDLLEYFDLCSFEESIKKMQISKNNLLKNETPVVAEIFLCARLLMKINKDLKWNLDDWWSSLKNYFCIIDNSSLDLLWHKYDWQYEYRFLRTYSNSFSRAVDFQDWLSLYQNLNNEWNLASNEHERYNESRQLINIFRD